MDFELNEEQRAFQDMARQFAAEQLAPPGVAALAQPAGRGVTTLVRHWSREGRLWLPETLLEA